MLNSKNRLVSLRTPVLLIHVGSISPYFPPRLTCRCTFITTTTLRRLTQYLSSIRHGHSSFKEDFD